MNEQQKDLLRKNLDNQLDYLESIQDNLIAYASLKNWMKKALVDNCKSELLMLGYSKKDLLLSFKEQISFPQKDFMEIIVPLSSWPNVYDTNLKSINPGDKRFYVVNSNHPKYKNFMLSVGLLDANFKTGFVIDSGYTTSLENYVQNNGKTKISSRCILEFHNSMIKLENYNFPKNIAELNNYMYYMNSVESLYSKIEDFGVENLKNRILEALESEKSK